MAPYTPKQFQIAQVSSKNDDKEIKDIINSQLYKYQNFMLIAKHNARSNDPTWVDYMVQKVA